MEDILEPLKVYNDIYKEKIIDNAKNKIDELAKKSNVSEEENKILVKEITELLENKKILDKKINKYNVLKAFMLIFGIVSFIFAIYLIYSFVNYNNTSFLIYGILCIIVDIVLIIIYFATIRKKYNALRTQVKNLVDKINLKISEALNKLQPLFDLFNYFIPFEIINDAIPNIKIYKKFDYKTFSYLRDRYNFDEIEDENTSSYNIIAGELSSNPFIIDRMLDMHMFNKTYTGTRVITWVTYSTDSQGRRVSHTHSQTLTATYTAPAPLYEFNTVLCYANDAAPNTNFSRTPTIKHKMSQKEIDSFVKKGEKKIQKISRNALKDINRNFTEMGNSEFDVLFNALDRDNDVEFRLMFTPLAQKNMLELIKTPKPYGDDFSFKKQGCLNYITTKHGQNMDIVFDENNYVDYNLDVVKEKVVSYVGELFQSIYFDLAPLMCIPLYQHTKPKEYEYISEDRKQNFTLYEVEALLNSCDASILSNKDTTTDSIIKAKIIKKYEKADYVKIDAHSFKGVPRIHTAMLLGGDGRMHAVDVHWIEYFKLLKTSYAFIFDATTISKEKILNCFSNNKNNVIILKNNLCAFITDDEQDYNMIENLAKEN